MDYFVGLDVGVEEIEKATGVARLVAHFDANALILPRLLRATLARAFSPLIPLSSHLRA